MSTSNSVETLVPGGWTPYHPLTAEDKKIFDEAMKGIIGVIYTPQSVSTQVVNGTNYRFKCTSSLPGQTIVWDSIVEIHKPINGAPYVIGIQRV